MDLPRGLRHITSGAPAQPVAQPETQPVYAATENFGTGQMPSFNMPGIGMIQAGSTFKGTDGKPYVMLWDGSTKVLGDMSQADQVGLARKKAEAEASVAGRRSMDVQFGKDYTTWTSGGRATAQRQLGTIQSAITALEAQAKHKPGAKNVSGVMSGALLPENVRSVVNPASLDLQKQIEGAIQLGLKNVLDSQFSAAEAAMFLQRAYDPRLGPEFNIPRLKAFRQEFQSKLAAKDAMSNFWGKNSTLEGFKGSALTTFKPAPANPVVGETYTSKTGRSITWVIDPKTNAGSYVYLD
jgi:hypothetical protein